MRRRTPAGLRSDRECLEISGLARRNVTRSKVDPPRGFALPWTPYQPATPEAAFATLAWGWILGFYGISVMIGDWARLPDNDTALRAVPGGPYVLGGLFVAFSALLIIGQRTERCRLRNTGVTGLVALCLGLAGLAVHAFFTVPDSPPGSAVLWGGIALQLAVLQKLLPRRVGP